MVTAEAGAHASDRHISSSEKKVDAVTVKRKLSRTDAAPDDCRVKMDKGEMVTGKAFKISPIEGSDAKL